MNLIYAVDTFWAVIHAFAKLPPHNCPVARVSMPRRVRQPRSCSDRHSETTSILSHRLSPYMSRR
jgi:hypothetical protein